METNSPSNTPQENMPNITSLTDSAKTPEPEKKEPTETQPTQETQQLPSSPIPQSPAQPEKKSHTVLYLVLTILLIGGNICAYLFIETTLMANYFVYSSIFLGTTIVSWILGIYKPLRFIFAIFLFLLFGFSFINPLWGKISPPEKDPTEYAEKSINNFFEANSKHGTFNYYIDRDGKIIEQDSGEFWIKGNKFLMQYPETANTKINVISNNESDVYFCYDSTKRCEMSPMPIEYYLMHYKNSSIQGENIGLDKKENCRKYKYSLKKIEEKPGSNNPWYVEDIIYCATNDSLYYFEDTGNSAKYGIPTDLRLFHSDIKVLELNTDIPNSKFELPYEIAEK